MLRAFAFVLALLAWFWALLALLWVPLVAFLQWAVTGILTLLLRPQTLLTGLVLWALGAGLLESHATLYEAIDDAWQAVAPFWNALCELLDALGDLFEKFACFYNLWVIWMRELARIAIVLLVECDNWQPFFASIFDLFTAAFLSLANFALNVLENEYDFFTVWLQFNQVLNTAESVVDCLCGGLLDPVVFIFDILRDSQLCCALDRFVNAWIKFWQAIANIFLMPNEENSFDDFFDTLCEGFICLGNWIDNTIFRTLDLFVPSPPNFNLGCALSRLVCILIEVQKLVVQIIIGAIESDLDNILSGDLLDPFIGRILEFADCIEAMFGVIDICLGQAVANIVRLFADFVIFGQDTVACLANIVDADDFFNCLDFSQIITGVERLLGNSQRFDSHIGQSNDCGGGSININGAPTPTCRRLRPQTSLTCLVSKLLGNGVCAREVGDTVNGIVDLLLLPLTLFNELIDAPEVDGNPIGTDDFEDYLTSILIAIFDPLTKLMDNFGHLLQCNSITEGLGDAFVGLADALDALINDVVDLLVLLIQFILQLVIWFLALFGQDPFDESLTSETSVLISLFFDIVITAFDLLLEIVKGIIDYLLFPFFPGLFGQDTLLCDEPCDPGEATFTNCVENFGDCLCGLTKQIAQELCFFGACLGDLWPDCEDFEEPEDRRRQIASGKGTVFAWWADNFNTTICGDTFESWRYGPPEPLSETEAAQYLTCVKIARQSMLNSLSVEGAGLNYFIEPDAIHHTLNQTNRGLGQTLSAAGINLLRYASSPDTVLDKPGASVSYINLAEALNVNDTVAYNLVSNITNGTKAIYNQMWNSLNATDFPRESFWHQTLDLTMTSFSLMQQGWGTFGSLFSLLSRRAIPEQFYNGTVDVASNLYDHITSQPEEVRTQQPRSWNPAGPHLQTITKTRLFGYRASLIYRGFSSYTSILFGPEQPPSLQDHIPNSCTEVSVGCNFDGTGCSSSALYENSFGKCNDFTALLSNYMLTTCNAENGTLALYSDDDCENFVQAVTGPLGSTCGFGTNGMSNWVCVTGCQACPVNNIISEFECPWMDEAVHSLAYLTKRCLAKLDPPPEIPVPTPIVLPEPTFAPTPFITEPPARTPAPGATRPPNPVIPVPVCRGEQQEPDCCANLGIASPTCCCCGDGIISYNLGERCEPVLNNTMEDIICSEVNCQLLPPPPLVPPPNCGDGILQPEEGELCDDGNQRSGDGCSQFCVIEKCPRIRYRKDVSDKDVSVDCAVSAATTSDPCDDGLCVTTSTPFVCFDLVDKGSVQANCISGDPFIGYHDEVDDCSNFISERDWSKSVLDVCVNEDYICIDEDCNYRIVAGIDFMCTEDCAVCGDGIVQDGEECDTGNLEDTNCFYCRLGCTCDDNTTKPCTGECFGGQVADGTVCDPRAVGNPCAGGMCVPTACCGDGIIQPPEECDDANNVNNDTCADNCTLTGMRKRQYIEARDIRAGLSEHVSNNMRHQRVYKAKTIDINQWIFDFWDWIFEILNIDTSSENLVDIIVGWFTKTGIDITLPPEERGVVWYAVFPFLLRPPWNLDCSLGLGSAETIRLLAVSLLPLSLFLGLILPAGWLNIFFIGFAFSFLTLFLGLAYGYPFPGAFLTPSTPPVPECLISDLADTCEIINSPCINWPEGVVLDPPDASCQPNRTLLDCRDIGWNDGFDWLVFNLEYHAPDFMDSFRDSYLFSMLTMHQYWVDIFERFDYGDDPIPDVDIYYCAPTALALGLGTIITISTIVAALLVALGYIGVALFNAFWACWLGNWAVITAWEDWEDESDN